MHLAGTPTVIPHGVEKITSAVGEIELTLEDCTVKFEGRKRMKIDGFPAACFPSGIYNVSGFVRPNGLFALQKAKAIQKASVFHDARKSKVRQGKREVRTIAITSVEINNGGTRYSNSCGLTELQDWWNNVAEPWFTQVYKGRITWDVEFHAQVLVDSYLSGNCGTVGCGTLADEIATAASIAASVQHIVIFAPLGWQQATCNANTYSCPFSDGTGRASLGCGSRCYAYMVETCAITTPPRVYWRGQLHEIGHNLGLEHAGDFFGGTYDEYGERADIMGTGTRFPWVALNAPHLQQEGLLEAAEFQEISSGGTHTLRYVYDRADTTSLKAIRTYTQEFGFLFVSYRFPNTFPPTADTYRSIHNPQVQNRLNIHGTKVGSGNALEGRTALVALLNVGESFTEDGLTITLDSVDGAGNAQVTFSGTFGVSATILVAERLQIVQGPPYVFPLYVDICSSPSYFEFFNIPYPRNTDLTAFLEFTPEGTSNGGAVEFTLRMASMNSFFFFLLDFISIFFFAKILTTTQ